MKLTYEMLRHLSGMDVAGGKVIVKNRKGHVLKPPKSKIKNSHTSSKESPSMVSPLHFSSQPLLPNPPRRF